MTIGGRIILLLLTLTVGVQSDCPRPQDLPDVPVRLDEGATGDATDVFLCARMYEHSHPEPNLSCGGAFIDATNGGSNPSLDEWHDRISSIVVRPGCELRLYEHHDYKGHATKLREGIHHRLIDHEDGDWNDMATSYGCSCGYTNVPLECSPVDEYSVGKSCTNNMDTGTMLCKYGVETGLSIGHSVTEGGSISETTQASLAATFKKVFSFGIGKSTTTTYDWSTSEDKVYSKVVTREVTCTVAPKTTVDFVMIVGRCDDTSAFTGEFACETRTS